MTSREERLLLDEHLRLYQVWVGVAPTADPQALAGALYRALTEGDTRPLTHVTNIELVNGWHIIEATVEGDLGGADALAWLTDRLRAEIPGVTLDARVYLHGTFAGESGWFTEADMRGPS